jgi:tetratricopeptide (TPR) repeat protein
MKHASLIAIILCSSFFWVRPINIFAAEYQGPAALIKKLSGPSSVPAASPSVTSKNLRSEIKEYQEKAAGLAVDEAASQWVTLCERLREGGRTTVAGEGERQVGFHDLVLVLPPPAAWSAIAKKIEARPADSKQGAEFGLGLKLFGHLLVGGEKAQWDDLAQIESSMPKSGRAAVESMIVPVTTALADVSADPGRIMAGTERTIDAEEAGNGRSDLRLDDLVTLGGVEKAKPLLRRAVLLPNLSRLIITGDETRRLARQLALENIDQLRRPVWELVDDLNSGALYEALDKKFPAETDREPYSRRQAGMYYLLGLIASQRGDDAAALVLRLNQKEIGEEGSFYLPSEALDALERAGHTQDVFDFLTKLLTKHAEIPFWDNYISMAARLGKTEEALALVRTTAEKRDLPEKTRTSMRGHLSTALIAADKVDEGVSILRELIASQRKELQSPAPKPAGTPSGSSAFAAQPPVSSAEQAISQWGDHGITLAQIGRLLKQTDWTNEGVAAARDAVQKLGTDDSTESYRREYLASRLANLFFDLGRGPEAEPILQDNILLAAHASDQRRSSMPPRGLDKQLLALLALYYRAGRPEDLLSLLSGAPQWGTADLANIVGEGQAIYSGHTVEIPLGYMVADALAAKDRKEEARKVLDATMDVNGGCDREYELLIKLGGNEVIDRLDTLFRRDQFEERPLIWKAHLLRLAGKLDEAEKNARAAIAIDPSDGEEGPGDRMRAYAVLADILADRGDTAQANSMREAVQAIRISEDADRYYEAGLLSRGVAMYNGALTHFEAAYCIQSRLALRLAELGRNEEAESHYRRAYELMPESFGRMESHCFGCEGAFNGRRAQSVAEKVFTQLAVKTPQKPQVHYLLGYLNEVQLRYTDALPFYRQAVALDPDYINAWKHIEELREHVALPIADRNAAALNLLRLDPQSRHVTPKLEEVSDLPALWKGVETAAKFQAPILNKLYPLAASKAELEKPNSRTSSQTTQSGDYTIVYRYTGGGQREGKSSRSSPADALARNRAVSAVTGMIDTFLRSGI